MANDELLAVPEPIEKPNGTSTPRAEKRCATESTVLLENASATPYRSAKKRLVLECDRTTLTVCSLNSSCRSVASSTPGRIIPSSRAVCITRGIQTSAPNTTNRYCQVSVSRVQKPTISTHVQTDEDLLCPQTPLTGVEIACQTDAPPLKETSVATTQTKKTKKAVPSVVPLPVVQREDAACQANMGEEEVVTTVAINENDAEQNQDQPPEPLECDSDDSEPMVDSISNMLNVIAKQYGIDLQSSTEKKKKKKSKESKKKQINQLEQCLVNKTYKAIASKVNEKLPTILDKHLAEYDRKTVASRQRLERWTKNFIQRQQQSRAASSSATGGGRRLILVRKVVRPPRQPTVKEMAVQCVTAELMPDRVTVSTQWQRQKPTVTKKKPVSKKTKAPSKVPPKISTTSTDSKTRSAGVLHESRRSMRQTKLSNYTKEQSGGTDIQGRQQQQHVQQERMQQGERSPKSSKSASVTGPGKPSATSPKTSKAPTQTAAKKTRSRKSTKPPVTEKIHIEETPSASSSDSEPERKHFPYRSPPRYPSQCSKSTETSFLTPSRVRNLMPEQDKDTTGGHFQNRTAREADHTMNPSVLLSPLERLYMEPATTAAAQMTNRSDYNTFLVPLAPRPPESIPPTPPRMVYLNPPERRVLLRSRRSNGGLVRQKPPEISIISSQQLYSQIGLAVEKALKARTIPTLDTMYGEPYIEVFNGTALADQDEEANSRAADVRTEGRIEKQQHPTLTDKFVCSSGKEDLAFLGSQQHFRRPPFHTERSPSLSPIVYQDDNSGDEII